MTQTCEPVAALVTVNRGTEPPFGHCQEKPVGAYSAAAWQEGVIAAFRQDLIDMDAGCYVAPLPHRSMVQS